MNRKKERLIQWREASIEEEHCHDFQRHETEMGGDDVVIKCCAAVKRRAQPAVCQGRERQPHPTVLNLWTTGSHCSMGVLGGLLRMFDAAAIDRHMHGLRTTHSQVVGVEPPPPPCSVLRKLQNDGPLEARGSCQVVICRVV